MLQDVSWSKKCFKMSLAEALGARNASRCLWQRRLEQEMLQDVSGRGAWGKKCFKMSLALGARNASRCLLEQEMLQDVSGRGAWSKKCFKMSLAEPLASRCLWQRRLEQEMLEDVSGRAAWSKKCFEMSLAEPSSHTARHHAPLPPLHPGGVDSTLHNKRHRCRL